MPLKLMCILAHPDDESLGTGGVLARYAAEGVQTQLVCLTRGQKGWKLGDHPGPEAVAAHRTRELCAAAKVLGVEELRVLDYVDGELDRADPEKVISELAGALLELAPDVVVTFGPDGAYGHPDHIAVSQFATAATVRAAALGHAVRKLYYMAETRALLEAYADVFGTPIATVDGAVRRFSGWDAWALTTQVEAREQVGTVLEAIGCHRSQLRDAERLLNPPIERWRALFGQPTFYRVFSLVNGGRARETSLFAGLRSG